MKQLLNILPITAKASKNLHIRTHFANSPFGKMLIASTEKGICSVTLVLKEQMHGSDALKRLQKAFPNATIEASSESLDQDFLKLFEKEPVPLTFHLKGTPFQLEVWNALLEIPFGETTTYGKLAAKIGRPKAHRAVGSAVGDNPIFFAIPCHRVLPASGSIGNYFWGSEIKQKILDWEKA